MRDGSTYTGAHTHFSEVGRVGFSVADYGSVSLPRGFTYGTESRENTKHILGLVSGQSPKAALCASTLHCSTGLL